MTSKKEINSFKWKLRIEIWIYFLIFVLIGYFNPFGLGLGLVGLGLGLVGLGLGFLYTELMIEILVEFKFGNEK